MMDMEEHRKTYEGFVKGSVAGTIGCLYILLALVAVTYAPWGTLICWLALIFGTVALVLDARSGNSRWPLSVGGLVLFSLLTLINT